MKGKDKCEFLKGIRKRMAEANGIPYEPRECTYEGECTGTCPFCEESTEKVHNVKWINNWTLLTGLLRNVKLLHIINVKYLRISLIFSTLAEKFSYARRLSANPIE